MAGSRRGLEATSLPAARVRGARRALLVIIAVAALIIPTDNTPHPERVTATVDKCDLSLHGAAQISFSLTNGDRTWHGYEVRAFVAGRQSQLGASTTLITHV